MKKLLYKEELTENIGNILSREGPEGSTITH